MDLHGLRAEEAVERTERFIIDSRKQGLTELRLIVGELLSSLCVQEIVGGWRINLFCFVCACR